MSSDQRHQCRIFECHGRSMNVAGVRRNFGSLVSELATSYGERGGSSALRWYARPRNIRRFARLDTILVTIYPKNDLGEIQEGIY
jgi:hypothetical protein